MRNLLITIMLTLFSLTSGLTQNSWVDVAVFTDGFPEETSWNIMSMEDSVVFAESSILLGPNSLHHEIVYLPAGPYIFTMYDVFGDGICCSYGEGWFSLFNTCGLSTMDPVFDSTEVSYNIWVPECEAPIFGCMDSDATNFHPWATMPAQCLFPPVQCEGEQTNIIVSVIPDTYTYETSWQITLNNDTIGSGSNYSTAGLLYESSWCVSPGDSIVFTVMDSFGDGLCGSCYGGVDGSISVTTLCGDQLFYAGDTLQFFQISDTLVVPQCIDPFSTFGCTEIEYTEYNPTATMDDGSCLTPVILGCVDSTAFNFDSLSNTMDMVPQCEFALTLTDGGNDGWFGAWMGVTQGDSVWGPFNMQEPIIHLPFTNGEEVEFYFFASGNSATTAAQCGFNLMSEDGQILIQGGTNPWTDPFLTFPYVYSVVPTCGNYCTPFIYGCMDEEAQNYSSGANTEDESCYYNAGCMSAGYLEYYTQDYEADFDDGSCETLAVFGCMDDTATNFDLESNVDNGSCIDTVVGCMDINAFNFLEEANVDNSESCLYDAGCIGEPGTPYWANDSCYSWIIVIDPYCCEVGWDNACIELYEYCAQDWPQGVPEHTERIKVYPNPTDGVLNIEAPLEAITALYNALGQLVVVGTREDQIDLTGLRDGVYEVVVSYKGRTTKQTIIKR